MDRRAGRHRSLSKCATVLPHGGRARSPRRSRQRAKNGRFSGQEDSARRPTCGFETQNRHPPALRDKIAGRARSSACEIHRSDAGDSALKDERQAPTEGARRDDRRLPTPLEGRNHGRRGSDTSVTPDLDYQVSGHYPLLKENKRFQAVQRLRR